MKRHFSLFITLYFRQRNSTTREVEIATTPKPQPATTPKEPRIIAEPDFVGGSPVVFFINKKEDKVPRLTQG